MTSCTVVIITYNRPTYLKRILDYFKANGAGLEFIIVDSSFAEDQVSNQKIVDFYNNQEGVKFTRYSYAESTSLGVKSADGVSKVKTEYCVLCADDDFVVPRGIEESIFFLDANPDFVAAHGKYISFRLNKNGSSEPKFCWQLAYPFQSNISPDPIKRFMQNLVDYFPTMYAVYRTEVFKNIWRGIVDSGLDLKYFGELLASILPLLYGKMKILDVFHCARQEDSAYAISHGIKKPSATDYIKERTYWPEYEKFKKYLISQFSKINDVSAEEASRAIDSAMNGYIQTWYPPVLDHYRYKVSAALANFFKKVHLPNPMYRSLSFMYRLFFPISDSKPNHDFIGTTLAHCQKDLDAVRDKVISFGKT